MTPSNEIPDSTAVRVALWRAMHVQLDSAPHVVHDELGLKLVNPTEDWKQRPDMHPQGTRGFRASIVGRARFIEDLVTEKLKEGVDQYVIVGAGLDTFAERRIDLASKLRIFEIDKAETQRWKQKRLEELGYHGLNHLKFVAVDFEAGESWSQKLVDSAFIAKKPAVFASTGVSMYLTKEGNLDTLKKIAAFAKGSTLMLSFLLPLDMIPQNERPVLEMVYEKARAAGTPFVSFFRPEEILQLGKEAGFSRVSHVSRAEIIEKYFKGRPDGLVPSSGEEFLVATI